ncbi:MAG TPA: redoxin domain-containing protein [Planctomycetes bacterium]|nr:redoxin domain-containing protein [Planctomycetota bacterium]
MRTAGRVAMTLAGVMLMGLFGFGGSDDPPLKVGDQVPDLTIRGSDGKDYRLRDFTGKQALVIAWFPRAFTPG